MSWAYLVITPDPTKFDGIISQGGTYPVQNGATFNVPALVGGGVPYTHHVKFGDQTQRNGRLGDYNTNNPNCVFRNIFINAAAFPTFNGLGKFLQLRVIDNFGNRNINVQPFRHVPFSEEWYYCWNQIQPLQRLVTLIDTATTTAAALLQINQQTQPQQWQQMNLANDNAQNALNQLIVPTITGYAANLWPAWSNLAALNNQAGNVAAANQRSLAMKQTLAQAVAGQQRVVWVDNQGVLIFTNELAAIIFFDPFIRTD